MVADEDIAEGYLRIQGVIYSKTFLHSQYKMFSALEAIKTDLITSMRVRLELFFEELRRQETAEKKDDPNSELFDPFIKSNFQINDKVWILPKRVIAPFIQHINVCDYFMPPESTKDCSERFAALLDLSIPLDKIEDVENFRKTFNGKDIDLEQDLLCAPKINEEKSRQNSPINIQTTEERSSPKIPKKQTQSNTSANKPFLIGLLVILISIVIFYTIQ
eukprot:TRINITY_DN9363_c0_g1_i1.p1 TRINITY_DN9363_c0_g1~~TRINITY_DN9363_c0_g1_i1.p1  ORF type:complete len:219 (-),score=27.89 TRINITY_DN9363_c0_g1_i1:1-657(-)